MEGYLLKKGRGEGGFFSRKNWKKRWFILEGTYVTYYESFNLNKNEPVNKKGTAPVRGCKIELDKTNEKGFGFVMTHDTRKPLHMEAETKKLMKLWMKALEKAAEGEVGSVTISFAEFFDALDMERDASYTHAELSKFYRKAALKNHPDKGGSDEAFKLAQEAFEVLKARLEEIEEEEYWTTMDYSATIVKCPDGVGFGMVVVEDAAKAQVIAKRVMEKIMVSDIDEISGGSIQAGDRIVRLDNDDISNWTLMRVVQRLNDFRVPVGSSVRFTFRRRVRVDGNEDKGGKVPENEGFEEDERIFQEQQARYQKEEEERKRMTEDSDYSLVADINDIDEDDEYEMENGINDIDDKSAGESDDRRLSSSDEVAVAAAEREIELQEERDRQEEKVRRRESWAQKESAEHIACLQAENDDLDSKVQDLRRDLKAAQKEHASLQNSYQRVVVELEDAREEAHSFLDQLEVAELECQVTSRREMAAMDVIDQMSSAANRGGWVGSRETSEVSRQVSKDVQEAADMVQKGYDLSGEFGYNMEDVIHLSNARNVEYAQKNAFSAAVMVDKSGDFLRKYDSESLGVGFINRLEQALEGVLQGEHTPADDDNGLDWHGKEKIEYPGRRIFDDVNGHDDVKRQPRRPPPRPEQPFGSNANSNQMKELKYLPGGGDYYQQSDVQPVNWYADLNPSQNSRDSLFLQPQVNSYQNDRDSFSVNPSHSGGIGHAAHAEHAPDFSSPLKTRSILSPSGSGPIKFGPRKKMTKPKKKGGLR